MMFVKCGRLRDCDIVQHASCQGNIQLPLLWVHTWREDKYVCFSRSFGLLRMLIRALSACTSCDSTAGGRRPLRYKRSLSSSLNAKPAPQPHFSARPASVPDRLVTSHMCWARWHT